MGFKDFYSIPGVTRDSGIDKIKNVYRKLVNRYHPDKHPEKNQDATSFIVIQEAYDVLGNPEKKNEYDKSYSL